MAKHDTISSTEKLLDLIRGKKPVKTGPPGLSLPKPKRPSGGSRPDPKRPSSGPPPSSKGPSGVSFSAIKEFDLKSRIIELFSFKRRITVGVSIGYSDLKLVKIDQTAGKNQELLNYSTVPFPAGINAKSPKFPQFLKRALSRFCGDDHNVDIWSAITSSRVEMRYLRIPKVPRKQIANTVYWTFKREVSFNEKEETFDFDLLGDVIENGIRKTEVMAYTAPNKEIKQIQEVFSRSDFRLTGITIVPFLLQNLLRSQWLEAKGKNVCSLYIGRDWSRIDIFSNGNLILSRGIKAGMKSMIEAIRLHFADTPAPELPESDEMELDSPFEMAEDGDLPGLDEANDLFSDFLKAGSVIDDSTGRTYTERDIFQMALPALERLIRQVDRTLEHFTLKFDRDGVDRIYISGPVNSQKLIVSYIGEQLGLQLDIFDPMAPESPISGEISPPESLAEREAFLPATGMALSNNNLTPNFIFTFKGKETAAKIRTINTALLIGLLAILAGCVSVFMWQDGQINQKDLETIKLRGQLDSFVPRVNKSMIDTMLLKVRKRQESVKKLGQRYLGVAVISEISRLTPASIRLLDIDATFPTGPDSKSRLMIEGIVFGDPLAFDSLLAEYLIKLEGSPVLSNFEVTKRANSFVAGSPILRFSAEFDVS